MNRQLEDLERQLLANDFEPNLNYTYEMVKRRNQERRLESTEVFEKIARKAKANRFGPISLTNYISLGSALRRDLSFPILNILCEESTATTSSRSSKCWGYYEITVAEIEGEYSLEINHRRDCKCEHRVNFQEPSLALF